MMLIKALLISLSIMTFNLVDFTDKYEQPKKPKQTLKHYAVKYTPAPLNNRDKMKSLKQIKLMLSQQAPGLSPAVINRTLLTLGCASKQNVDHNNIIAIIDFSLPSSQKRLWVFDLAKGKLLFHTYVSHGIKSGSHLSNYFSNKFNSKASSIGVFNTENSYYGRHGYSLKLLGQEKNINHNAYNRFIVMHGSWYVNESFIKKYGRAGRSWGCPAVPSYLVKPIINTIKDNALLIAYYPNEEWVNKSKFVNCPYQLKIKPKIISTKPLLIEEENRGEITYLDLNNNNKREENEPVVVISADNYARIFESNPPLKRMLRRRINNEEYIVLNNHELALLDNNNDHVLNADDTTGIKNVKFVIPVVKRLRGYWATEMKPIFIGEIKQVKLDSTSDLNSNHEVQFQKKSPCYIRSTNRFIRWLGL